ncbi:hypothetical protein LCGC14_1251460 [marine sediment metagenome]|uniref:Uncharacterized protein n=1 Tax=marine sediment metagenome TaxID=412755 RepID=A0A0F9NK29_9ZZZZ
MTKIYTATHEYKHCAVCSEARFTMAGKFKCRLRRRIIKDIEGDIPDFCPLPDKEEKK